MRLFGSVIKVEGNFARLGFTHAKKDVIITHMKERGLPRELKWAFGAVALLSVAAVACASQTPQPQPQPTPEATRAPIPTAIVTAAPAAEKASGAVCYFPQMKERKPPTNMRNIMTGLRRADLNGVVGGAYPKLSMSIFNQLITEEVVTDPNVPCQKVTADQKAMAIFPLKNVDASLFSWNILTCAKSGYWSNEERNMIFSTPGEAESYIKYRAKNFVRHSEAFTATVVPDTGGYVARLGYQVNELGDYDICHTYVDGKPSYDGGTFTPNQYLHLIP